MNEKWQWQTDKLVTANSQTDQPNDRLTQAQPGSWYYWRTDPMIGQTARPDPDNDPDPDEVKARAMKDSDNDDGRRPRGQTMTGQLTDNDPMTVKDESQQTQRTKLADQPDSQTTWTSQPGPSEPDIIGPIERKADSWWRIVLKNPVTMTDPTQLKTQKANDGDPMNPVNPDGSQLMKWPDPIVNWYWWQ